MEKREKLLYLAIAVAILGTAALYALSASMETEETTLTPSEVLKNPTKYLGKDIEVYGNITDIREYGNTTVFYLRDTENTEYSLRCVSFDNITMEEGAHTVKGRLEYNEEWGNYEMVAEEMNRI